VQLADTVAHSIAPPRLNAAATASRRIYAPTINWGLFLAREQIEI
jgi:hypothetical protein